MSRKQAPAFCICLADSTWCQAIYVGTSSLAFVLLMVILVAEIMREGSNPTVSWDTYIIQDWGKGTCSNGTRLDDIGSCRTAFNAYKEKCETRDDEPQSESWDGQPGCHIQDGGFAEFQFNENLNDHRTVDHAPVCQVGKAQPLKCYDENAQEEAEDSTREPYRSIFLILIVIPPVVMSISRLCVPACCPGGMESVPGCFPLNCFTQLDTTYYVAGVIQLPFLLLEFTDASAVASGIILRILVPCVVIATVVTTIVKLSVMAGCSCQECNPASRSPRSPIAGASQTVVVGQVVVGQPVGGQPVSGKAVD